MSWCIDTLLEQRKDHPNKSCMPYESRKFLITHLPKTMLCSSSLKTENPKSYLLEKHIALKNEHIQPNHENMWKFIIIDDDVNSPDAYLDLPVPPPNLIVINPESGHCQRWYFLANGVSRSPQSQRKFQDYYLKTLFKLTAIYHGDAAYNGNLARNPVYPKHICLYPRLKPYTLNELNSGMGISKSDYEKGNYVISHRELAGQQEYAYQNKRTFDVIHIIKKKSEKLMNYISQARKMLNSSDYQLIKEIIKNDERMLRYLKCDDLLEPQNGHFKDEKASYLSCIQNFKEIRSTIDAVTSPQPKSPEREVVERSNQPEPTLTPEQKNDFNFHS